MKDTFYDRLDFYRMLEEGRRDLEEISAALRIELKILQSWERKFDPKRGPFGTPGVEPAQSSLSMGQREDVLAAMRREALKGSVPAAKLLLTEYEDQPAEEDEVLTVEKAVALLREWRAQEAPAT
jgi:hypothetical protein